jgi:hypothetical protein
MESDDAPQSTAQVSSKGHPLLTLQALNAGPSPVPTPTVTVDSERGAPSSHSTLTSASAAEGQGVDEDAHPFQAHRQERYEELCRSLNLDEETRKIGWDLLRRLTLKAGQQDEVPFALDSCMPFESGGTRAFTVLIMREKFAPHYALHAI